MLSGDTSFRECAMRAFKLPCFCLRSSPNKINEYIHKGIANRLLEVSITNTSFMQHKRNKTSVPSLALNMGVIKEADFHSLRSPTERIKSLLHDFDESANVIRSTCANMMSPRGTEQGHSSLKKPVLGKESKSIASLGMQSTRLSQRALMLCSELLKKEGVKSRSPQARTPPRTPKGTSSIPEPQTLESNILSVLLKSKSTNKYIKDALCALLLLAAGTHDSLPFQLIDQVLPILESKSSHRVLARHFGNIEGFIKHCKWRIKSPHGLGVKQLKAINRAVELYGHAEVAAKNSRKDDLIERVLAKKLIDIVKSCLSRAQHSNSHESSEPKRSKTPTPIRKDNPQLSLLEDLAMIQRAAVMHAHQGKDAPGPKVSEDLLEPVHIFWQKYKEKMENLWREEGH